MCQNKCFPAKKDVLWTEGMEEGRIEIRRKKKDRGLKKVGREGTQKEKEEGGGRREWYSGGKYKDKISSLF